MPTPPSAGSYLQAGAPTPAWDKQYQSSQRDCHRFFGKCPGLHKPPDLKQAVWSERQHSQPQHTSVSGQVPLLNVINCSLREILESLGGFQQMTLGYLSTGMAGAALGGSASSSSELEENSFVCWAFDALEPLNLLRKGFSSSVESAQAEGGKRSLPQHLPGKRTRLIMPGITIIKRGKIFK